MVLWWLGWYIANRCDAIIIYDDHSTDGTWELLSDAARAFDIRLTRVAASEDHWELRKDKCHQDAIRRYGSEFDWIGFLDPDEYVTFAGNGDLKDFLSLPRFDQFDAVAINWCTYGTSGFVMKSKMPPYVVYTKHSNETRPINRLVKSFVRPARVGDRIITAHRYDIPADRYAGPDGDVVRWEPPGIGSTNTDPDWSTARIAHHIIRSVEDFVERVRHRADLWHVGYDYLISHDFNDLQSPPALHIWNKAMPVIATITRERLKSISTQIVEDVNLPRSFDPADKRKTFGAIEKRKRQNRGSVSISRIKTKVSTGLYVNKEREVVHASHASAEKFGLNPLFAAALSRRQTHVFLFAADACLIRIINDMRFLSFASYRSCLNEEKSGLGLRQLGVPVYISAYPTSGAIGSVIANQPKVGTRETLHFSPVTEVERSNICGHAMNVLSAMTTLPDDDLNATNVKSWISELSPIVRPDALPLVLSLMPAQQQRVLQGLVSFDFPAEI
jgi:hypothetical protein